MYNPQDIKFKAQTTYGYSDSESEDEKEEEKNNHFKTEDEEMMANVGYLSGEAKTNGTESPDEAPMPNMYEYNALESAIQRLAPKQPEEDTRAPTELIKPVRKNVPTIDAELEWTT